MGASISFDSKYRLVLDTEVECISVNPPDASATHKSKKSDRKKNNHHDDDDDNDRASGSGSDSASGSGSDSASGSGSDSDSDDENKTYTVKITPEITSYIRSYLRKTQFLDEFDLITEIELDNYNHAPGSALVFNSDSVVFITNNQTIEAVGEWEYLPPEHQEPPASKSKSKSKSKDKSKSKNRRDRDRDDSESEDDHADDERSKYKTKEDDLPVSEIENIMKEKFEEYNKTHEFIIHESKNSFLCLKINSVEIVKA
jgi:hypothetical protein